MKKISKFTHFILYFFKSIYVIGTSLYKQTMFSLEKDNDISFIIVILDMGQHYHFSTTHKPVLSLWVWWNPKLGLFVKYLNVSMQLLITCKHVVIQRITSLFCCSTFCLHTFALSFQSHSITSHISFRMHTRFRGITRKAVLKLYFTNTLSYISIGTYFSFI